MSHDLQHKFIGPFQFLIYSLSISESLLGFWLFRTDIVVGSTERIVAGSLSVAVLIAVLVVFCIIYWIKKTRGDFDKSH